MTSVSPIASVHQQAGRHRDREVFRVATARERSVALEYFAKHSYVVTIVASAFGVPTSELTALTRRRPHIALARQVAMYLMHVTCGASLSQTGRLFMRDRTTAGHACRMVEDMRDDPDFDVRVAALDLAIRCSWCAMAASMDRRVAGRPGS